MGAVNIDEIKQANRIEDLIQESGIQLTGHGRYLRSSEHKSFVVDTFNQSFHDNGSRYAGGAEGDIVDWVQHWKRCDFKEAIEFLARHAGMDEPEWGSGDSGQRLAARAREDALTVASRIFVHRLWRHEAALAYARGRGWTDETIKAAGLGFTGVGSPEQAEELRAAFEASGVDPESPGAVAILGYEGDLKAWADRWQLKELPVGWLSGETTRLYPIWREHLVYPHVRAGRVVYVSLRAIDPNVDPKHKSKNLKSALVGPRQPYFNWLYSPGGDRFVVVEGQADAITLAQMGIEGGATMGTNLSNLGKELRQRRKGQAARHVYVGLDQDEVGASKGWKMAQLLGPLTRLVRWPAHDANEWLQGMAAEGVAVETQAERAAALLGKARPLVVEMASKVGDAQGAERDDRLKALMAIVAEMDQVDLSLQMPKLLKAAGLNKRDFQDLQKKVAKEIESRSDGEDEERIQEIVGEHIKGWLIELLYRPEENRTLFAYRDPDGKIGTTHQLEIDGVIYKPKAPDSLITQEQVVLPSGLGEEMSERQLVDKIVDLVHRYYLIDPFYEKLIAYYVLFSWVADSFRNVVYLRMNGAAGAGKSQLMTIAGYISRRLIQLTGADSEAALYRTLHIFKGTLFIDEADKAESDTDSPFIKILNVGYRWNGYITKMRDKGGGEYVPEGFSVFGPKLITTRKKFDDDGLESRCLTIEVIKHTTSQLKNRNIPVTLETDFFDEAAELRNELLTWRLKNWQEDMRIDPELVDSRIDPRLNQVMTPIIQIVKDAGVRGEIQDLVRRYHERLTTEKSMRLEAKVLQALIQIQEEPPIDIGEDGKPCSPYWDLSIGNVAKVANEIIDEENADPDDEEGDKGSGKKLTNRGVGAIVNNKLNLVSARQTSGPLKGKYVVQWDEERINGLKVEYGFARADE